MTIKDRATQSCVFSNFSNQSANLTHENLTPTTIAGPDVLSSRIVSNLDAAVDPTKFFTPEENQELYRQMLIEEAIKTPRLKRPKITFFQKKKQRSIHNYAYYAMSESAETPKRDVSLKTLGNLESRYGDSDSDASSSPLVNGNDFLSLARLVSPIRQRRVVINRLRRRNSLVRRAIANRKRARVNNMIAKRRKFHCNLLSPSNANTTMPLIVNSPVINVNLTNQNMSKSIDSFHTKPSKTPKSTSVRLLRSKNFENLARYRDENHNIQDLKCESPYSSVSTHLSSTEQVTVVQSLPTEMNKVTLLSEDSLLRVNKTDSSCFIPQDIENSEKWPSINESFIPDTNGSGVRCTLKKTTNKLWKRKWKFWRTSVNSI